MNIKNNLTEISLNILCSYCGKKLNFFSDGVYHYSSCDSCGFMSKIINVNNYLKNNKCCSACFSPFLGITLDFSLLGLCSNPKCPKYEVISIPLESKNEFQWKINYENQYCILFLNSEVLTIRIGDYYFGYNHEMEIPRIISMLIKKILYYHGIKLTEVIF